MPNSDIKEDNFDWDVHTETHLSGTFESEFILEDFPFLRSKSLPTMFIDEEDDDGVQEGIIIETCNHTTSRPPSKLINDTHEGKKIMKLF